MEAASLVGILPPHLWVVKIPCPSCGFDTWGTSTLSSPCALGHRVGPGTHEHLQLGGTPISCISVYTLVAGGLPSLGGSCTHSQASSTSLGQGHGSQDSPVWQGLGELLSRSQVRDPLLTGSNKPGAFTTAVISPASFDICCRQRPIPSF